MLASVGVDRDHALAFALVYHAVHVLPTTLAGALALAAGAASRRAKHDARPREGARA